MFRLCIILIWVSFNVSALPHRERNIFSKRDLPINIETTFRRFVSCSSDQIGLIKQDLTDAVTIAAYGLDQEHDELSDNMHNDYKATWTIDFKKEASIDYFGPEPNNQWEQDSIVGNLWRASQAYRGWGWSDYWYNRYVTISCLDEYGPDKGCGESTVAYYWADKRYGDPLIVVCKRYWEYETHDTVYKEIDKNTDLQVNVYNMVSRATTLLHELLHISWSSAQICYSIMQRHQNNPDGCADFSHQFGGKIEPCYGPGAAKVLAQQNSTWAGTNSDNYVFYAASRYMEKKFKQYPRYPSPWDEKKSVQENWAVSMNEPGFPPRFKSLEWNQFPHRRGPESPEITAPGNSKSAFKPESYPGWYQPKIRTPIGDRLPDIHPPPDGPINVNMPNFDDIVCETTNSSPYLRDCQHATGSLKQDLANNIYVLRGKTGGSWWPGYVDSCAIAVDYTQDWTDKCLMTAKEAGNYATAIMMKCNKADGQETIGGRAPIAIPNCPGQIQLRRSDGSPPQGEPPSA